MSSNALALDVKSPYNQKCWTNSVVSLYQLLLKDLNARIFRWVRWIHLSGCWSPCLFWSSPACPPRWICPCSWSGWRTLSTCTIFQSFPHDFQNTRTLSFNGQEEWSKIQILYANDFQCFGSAFIWYGSGSSILGWIPIRIQGFDDQKL